MKADRRHSVCMADQVLESLGWLGLDATTRSLLRRAFKRGVASSLHLADIGNAYAGMLMGRRDESTMVKFIEQNAVSG